MILPLLTFFTIDSGMISDMIGYIGDIFNDFSPVLLIILGVSLGLMVITVIINAVKR